MVLSSVGVFPASANQITKEKSTDLTDEQDSSVRI